MRIMITSFRGHHEAEVLDPEVAKAIYDKMSGKTEEPLPEVLKTQVPDTFQELEALWKEGRLGYSAVSKDKDDELIPMREFDPQAEVLCFLGMIQGG
jgi:hypothetical protein